MSRTALLDALRQEHAAVLAFIALLEAEGAALSRRAQPAELGTLTDDKNRLADELQRWAQIRADALASLGQAPGHAGTEAAVAHDAELGAAWQQLQAAGEQARQLNERNGVFIRTHLKFASESLAALRSAAASTAPYDATGRTTGGLSPARGRSRQA